MYRRRDVTPGLDVVTTLLHMENKHHEWNLPVRFAIQARSLLLLWDALSKNAAAMGGLHSAMALEACYED